MSGNKRIFDLPLRTGVTANDRLAIVDSGNTTTYSVKVSDLQDGTGVNSIDGMTGDILTAAGAGIEIISESGELNINNIGVLTLEGLFGDILLSGGTDITITDNGTNTITIEATGSSPFIAANGTNNVISNYYPASNISNTTSQTAIIGGTGNIIIDNTNESAIIAGNTNYYVNNNTNSVILGGNTNYMSFTNNNAVIAGNNNTIQYADNSAILGGVSNSGGYDRSVILGGTSQVTLQDDEVVVPKLRTTKYTSLNFSGDTAAAAGGVQLGEFYHDNGLVRIRII